MNAAFTTAEQLLGLMPILQGQGWRVDKSGRIRNDERRCPGCALAQAIVGADEDYPWFTSVNRAMEDVLGRSTEGHEVNALATIAHAADWQADSVRPALMQALGMPTAS